jgi:hypothetical protein
LDLYSANSLKEQSLGRHVTPLGHIILIPSQPVFALTPESCVLSGEANTHFIVFGMSRLGLERTQVFDKRKCGIVSSFIVDNHRLFCSHYSAKNQIFTSNLKMATIRKKKNNSKLCNQIGFGLVGLVYGV